MLKLTKCKLDLILGSKQYFRSYVFLLFWSYGHLFGHLAIWFSIYLFLWIRSNEPARYTTTLLLNVHLQTFEFNCCRLEMTIAFKIIPKGK